MAHLQTLQKIADEHGANRAAGTAGFEATVDYAADVLRGAGFAVNTPTYTVAGDEDVQSGTGYNVIAQTGTGDPDHVVMNRRPPGLGSSGSRASSTTAPASPACGDRQPGSEARRR
jgi:hypothetical protein